MTPNRYGSEFDQRVAFSLLGQPGLELLTLDGTRAIVQVLVPGDMALVAAHPTLSINDMRRRGDIPNLADNFLKAWAYRTAYRGFQSRKLKPDCGMIFRSKIPAEWVAAVEILAD